MTPMELARRECLPCEPVLPDPTCPCVSIDPASLQQLARALYQGPPLYTQPVPRLAPSRLAKFWERYNIFVVAPNTATGDASAILGAADLATSETAARSTTVSVLSPATLAATVSLFSETMDDNQALRVTHFGARVHSSMRFIRLQVNVDGMPVNDDKGANNSGLYEMSDFADLDTPMDFYAEVQPRKMIEVTARNLDLNSGYLVEMLLRGYTYPTEFAGPGDRESIVRSGR